MVFSKPALRVKSMRYPNKVSDTNALFVCVVLVPSKALSLSTKYAIFSWSLVVSEKHHESYLVSDWHSVEFTRARYDLNKRPLLRFRRERHREELLNSWYFSHDFPSKLVCCYTFLINPFAVRMFCTWFHHEYFEGIFSNVQRNAWVLCTLQLLIKKTTCNFENWKKRPLFYRGGLKWKEASLKWRTEKWELLITGFSRSRNGCFSKSSSVLVTYAHTYENFSKKNIEWPNR